MKFGRYVMAAFLTAGFIGITSAQDFSMENADPADNSQTVQSSESQMPEYEEDMATTEMKETLELDDQEARKVQIINGNTVNRLITSWYQTGQNEKSFEKVYKEIQQTREAELQAALSPEHYEDYNYYKRKDPLIAFKMFDYADDKFAFKFKEDKKGVHVESSGNPDEFLNSHKYAFNSTAWTNLQARNYAPVNSQVYSNIFSINKRAGLPMTCGAKQTCNRNGMSTNSHFDNEAYARHMKGQSPGVEEGNKCSKKGSLMNNQKSGSKSKSSDATGMNETDKSAVSSETKVREESKYKKSGGYERPLPNDGMSTSKGVKNMEIEYEDGSKFSKEGDEYKYKEPDGTKVKQEGENFKIKYDDGTKIKYENGETKVKK